MLDLAGTDPEGERADPAMRGGVTVPADDGGPGERKALFRPDDMDDALLRRVGGDVGHAEFRRVADQRGKLRGAFGIGDGELGAVGRAARRGREIVVGHRQRQVGPPHLAACDPQTFERLWAGDFVDQVAVDIDEAGTVRAPFDDMGVPDLFVQGAGAAGHEGEGYVPYPRGARWFSLGVPKPGRRDRIPARHTNFLVVLSHSG